MALTPATRLGPFVILDAIGAGAMGEVYRARDTRLNRDVAIKVLPAAFIENGERLQRFTLEAQLLAQLHHPNIATVFGLEESSGEHALVMEFIDGQDLSARIARRADPARRGVADRETDRRGARSGARARDRPPRPQAGQRQGQPGRNRSRCSTSGWRRRWIRLGCAGARATRRQSRRAPHSTGRFSARPPIWPPSRRAGRRSIAAPTSGPSASSSSKCWPAGAPSREMRPRTCSPPCCSRRSTGARCPPARHHGCGGCWSDVSNGTRGSACATSARRASRSTSWRKDASHKADARVPPAGVMSAVRARAGRPMTVVSAVALLALGFALGRFAGWPAGPDPAAVAAAPVAFERLTYQSGHFVNARFAPDGQTVFLSAAWRGAREVFQVRPQARELPVGLPNAELLSVSRSGELALLLPRVETGNPYVSYGTLAVVSASGGTPRELAENVSGCRLGAGRRESGGAQGRRKQAAVGIPSGNAALRVGVPGLRASCVASRRQRGLFRAGCVGPVVGRPCRSFRPAADSVEGLGRLVEPGVVA